ncbi:MAG: type II toxin-antitoxin system VapC family toxin [Bacteroidetes bacterium]|nr:MAG: type II toxin-antitoxin system VapC family toxin [Bacteroidota bacterium]
MVTDKIALDTNIAVDVLNAKTATITLLEAYNTIYLPVTVCGELLFGAKNSSKKVQNEQKYKDFIAQYEVLNVHDAVAEEYAEIRKQLKDKGNPIPENDIWIAAICKVNDVPLITHDKHFSHVEGLAIIHIPFVS